jgi:hypothetical protein
VSEEVCFDPNKPAECVWQLDWNRVLHLSHAPMAEGGALLTIRTLRFSMVAV